MDIWACGSLADVGLSFILQLICISSPWNLTVRFLPVCPAALKLHPGILTSTEKRFHAYRLETTFCLQ